jgi:DNA-binding NarL/FixJ family response regulator
VKVLMISVLEELAHPQEALEAGADQVLGKITSTDRVVATIRSLKGEQFTAIHPTS